MGLDSYFLKKEADKAIPLNDDPRVAGVNLCGGMFSGNGADWSFRGKVYNDFLEQVAPGFSLYVEEQGPEAYGRIPAAIEAWLERHPNVEEFDFGVTRQEANDLKILFEAARDQGALLVGWW